MNTFSSPVHGILFDKDGTLIDYHDSFMPLNWQMARTLADGDEELARELMILGGWDPDSDRITSGSALAAWTLREIAELMHQRLGGDVGFIYEAIHRSFEDGPTHAVAVADLPGLLGPMKSAGIRLGISTSDHTRAAQETVERFQLSEIMDFVIGYDAGYGPKPTPGIINGFCAMFDINAANVMVVGDNSHDIDFARNGGAGWAVGVLTGTSSREELEPIADVVIDDITEIPALIASISSHGNDKITP